MKRKRHSGITEAEAALGRVLQVLELDDTPLLDPDRAAALVRRYHGALTDLLVSGPLLSRDASARELLLDGAGPPLSDQDVVLVRAELLQLFRSTVRGEQIGAPSSDISTYGRVAFTVHLSAGKSKVIEANGDTRDVVVLQALLLLQQVGLANVQACAAPDCRRCFVKVYRREFCSKQCQKRINMRKQRHAAKVLRERRAQRRRERRKGSVGNG